MQRDSTGQSCEQRSEVGQGQLIEGLESHGQGRGGACTDRGSVSPVSRGHRL